MNIENIDKAIAVMERAKVQKSLDMVNWQSVSYEHQVVNSEAELHACGNKACFAGHIAISPEWIEAGGNMTHMGEPWMSTPWYQDAPYYDRNAEMSISYWLGISRHLALNLIFGDVSATDGGDSYSNFYEKRWSDVEAQDVIDKLLLIRSGELE